MWSNESEYEQGIEEGLSGDDFSDLIKDGARAMGEVLLPYQLSDEYLRGVDKGREIRHEREAAAKASAKEQSSSSSGDYYCSDEGCEPSGQVGDWLSTILLLAVLAFVGAAFVGKPVGFLLFLICFVWLVVRSALNK